MMIIAKREESEGNGGRVSAGVGMGVESRRGKSTDLEYVTHSTYLSQSFSIEVTDMLLPATFSFCLTVLV